MKVSKTNILWWIIILLAVLNIATIGTIIYHNYTERDLNDAIMFEPDAPVLNGRYFRHQLDFNNSQMEVFRTNNQIFRPKANAIIHSINLKKNEMFTELKGSRPDTHKLDIISEEIGELHAELKKATVAFYLSLHEISNDKQKIELQKIFTPLFENISLPGSGNRRNHNLQYDNQDSNND